MIWICASRNGRSSVPLKTTRKSRPKIFGTYTLPYVK